MAIAVHQFQSYDIRPKAATEINDMKEVSRLLSHTEEEITKRVYMRVGAIAKPSIERKFRNAFRIISGLYP